MFEEKIKSAVRHALSAVGGYLVLKGVVPSDVVEPVVSSTVDLALGVVSWGFAQLLSFGRLKLKF